MSKNRPQIKKEDLMLIALSMAEAVGYFNVRRDTLATIAGVSGGSVNYHFGNMAQLKRDIVRHAIKNENWTVLGQALAMRDPLVMKLDEAARERIAKMLTL